MATQDQSTYQEVRIKTEPMDTSYDYYDTGTIHIKQERASPCDRSYNGNFQMSYIKQEHEFIVPKQEATNFIPVNSIKNENTSRNAFEKQICIPQPMVSVKHQPFEYKNVTYEQNYNNYKRYYNNYYDYCDNYKGYNNGNGNNYNRSRNGNNNNKNNRRPWNGNTYRKQGPRKTSQKNKNKKYKKQAAQLEAQINQSYNHGPVNNYNILQSIDLTHVPNIANALYYLIDLTCGNGINNVQPVIDLSHVSNVGTATVLSSNNPNSVNCRHVSLSIQGPTMTTPQAHPSNNTHQNHSVVTHSDHLVNMVKKEEDIKSEIENASGTVSVKLENPIKLEELIKLEYPVKLEQPEIDQNCGLGQSTSGLLSQPNLFSAIYPNPFSSLDPVSNATNDQDADSGSSSNPTETGENQLKVTNLPKIWGLENMQNFLDMAGIERPQCTTIVQNEGKISVILDFRSMEQLMLAKNKLIGMEIAGVKLDIQGGIDTVNSNAALVNNGDKVLWRPDLDINQRDPMGLYGLRRKYLSSLKIKPPLEQWVSVTNFNYDKVTLCQILQLAGRVVMCDVTEQDGCYRAQVMYSHPLEAVQAISMFHDRPILGFHIVMDSAPERVITPFRKNELKYVKPIYNVLEELKKHLKGLRTPLMCMFYEPQVLVPQCHET